MSSAASTKPASAAKPASSSSSSSGVKKNKRFMKRSHTDTPRKRGGQYFLAKGVPRYGPNGLYKAKRKYLVKGKKSKKTAPKAAKTPTVQKTFQGKIREIFRRRQARLYPQPIVRRKKAFKAKKPCKLRKKITPGTVLILLAGRFRGRRVVFLKQLESGLLLFTGPFKVNGVPLRRIAQSYVIATSTKVPLPAKLRLSKISDQYFKKGANKKTLGKSELNFFHGGRNPHTVQNVPDTRIAFQKAIDEPIIAEIKKENYLREYLNTSFSLKPGQYPHKIKF